MTSYIGLLAIFGLFCYIWGSLSKDLFDNELGPWIGLIISLWLTVFIENWKRMQNRLAYYFDVYGSREDEPLRFEYRGNYVIDTNKKQIVKQDRFPTEKRRLVVDVPMFLVGTSFVAASFFFFDWLTNYIINLGKTG